MITYIGVCELEQIARRVWYAKFPKAERVNGGEEKHTTFEDMGYRSRSTEFPRSCREWTPAGSYEMCISYPHWDVLGIIRVRKAPGKPKRTRAEYNLERKIKSYIRKNKINYRYVTGGPGCDTRGLIDAIARDLSLSTPETVTAARIVNSSISQ